MQRWGAVPATEPGTPTLRSSAPGPNLFAWPGYTDLTHISDEITGEIAVLLFGIPLGKKGEKQSRSLHSSAPVWVSTPNYGDSFSRSGLSKKTPSRGGVGVLGGPFSGLIAELRCGGHQLLPELKIPFARFPFQLGRV